MKGLSFWDDRRLVSLTAANLLRLANENGQHLDRSERPSMLRAAYELLMVKTFFSVNSCENDVLIIAAD